MAKFNSKGSGTKTINRAGGKAYTMDKQYELITLVLSSFLGDNYYEASGDRFKRLISLIENNKPEFVANLAVYARKVFHMRSVSHVLLAELARIHKGDSLVKNAIIASCERPDDLTEIVSYYGSIYGKPIPNSIKKGVAEALKKFNAYALTKYKSSKKDVKLVDLFNLVHPKGTSEQMIMWGKLLKGELQPPETWEVKISTAKNKEEAKRAWEMLISENKLGYMAMLRNLRNFDKYEISQEARNKVCDYLNNDERIKKSKQLPFRFYQAYVNAPTTQFKDAVSFALDKAICNVPKFEGKTLVCIDISGSMSSHLSDRGATRFIDIATLFGTALFKANPNNTDVFLFHSDVSKVNFSSRTPLIDLMGQINTPGGSTELYLVFQVLIQQKMSYDRIIILSDMQAWDSSGYNNSVNSLCEKWKHEMNINPKIYSLDLSGYGDIQFPQNNTYLLAGWSEKIFDLMKVIESDPKILLNTIENYEIS